MMKRARGALVVFRVADVGTAARSRRGAAPISATEIATTLEVVVATGS